MTHIFDIRTPVTRLRRILFHYTTDWKKLPDAVDMVTQSPHTFARSKQFPFRVYTNYARQDGVPEFIYLHEVCHALWSLGLMTKRQYTADRSYAIQRSRCQRTVSEVESVLGSLRAWGTSPTTVTRIERTQAPRVAAARARLEKALEKAKRL